MRGEGYEILCLIMEGKIQEERPVGIRQKQLAEDSVQMSRTSVYRDI